jgi:hypothetical protein
MVVDVFVSQSVWGDGKGIIYIIYYGKQTGAMIGLLDINFKQSQLYFLWA